MTHLDPERLLDLALDTLSPADATAAQAHVEDCSTCAAAYARLQEEQRVLRQAVAREPALPPGLRASILAAGLSSVGRPFRRAPRVLVVAAAALVALAAGFFLRPDERKQFMLEQVRTSELMALGLEDAE